MLKFNKLKFKNFLSYGNSWTEFEFEKGISRITADNGKGKSAIVDALYFALFGKSYRKINLGSLINSINKSDLLVELEFTNNDTEYKIIRGIKPNIFYIYENDILKSLNSTNRSYQQMLEQDILHFNENVFNQTTCKSITKNISFLSLSKADRRLIVEGIFGIEAFSEMNHLCKIKLDDIENTIFTLKKEIEYTSILIEQEIFSVERLKQIQQKINEESQQKVEEINAEIKTLQEDIQKYTEALKKIEEFKLQKSNAEISLSSIKSEIAETRSIISKTESEIKLAQFKLNLFNKTCAGCEQIKNIASDLDLTGLEEEQQNQESKLKRLTDQITTVRNELSKFEKILANEKFINGNFERATKRITELKKTVYVETIKDIEISTEHLNQHETKKLELEKKYNNAYIQKNHYAVIKTLLSDEGIKSFVIKRHLSSINKLLNTYLQKFNADILFYFNEEFNEVIASRYKESFNYFNFSEGQKRRIDLAIMFTFMGFSKMRNKKSSTNLLILDEISSMLDAIGENGLYDILKDLCNKENKSILSISHSGNIDPEKIDKLYQVSIEKGFSKLERINN